MPQSTVLTELPPRPSRRTVSTRALVFWFGGWAAFCGLQVGLLATREALSMIDALRVIGPLALALLFGQRLLQVFKVIAEHAAGRPAAG